MIARSMIGNGLVCMDEIDIMDMIGVPLDIMIIEGNIKKEIQKALKIYKHKYKQRSKIVVNITGGKNITIKQCHEIVSFVASFFHKNSEIVWGASVNTHDNKLNVLLMISVKGKNIQQMIVDENRGVKHDKQQRTQKSNSRSQ